MLPTAGSLRIIVSRKRRPFGVFIIQTTKRRTQRSKPKGTYQKFVEQLLELREYDDRKQDDRAERHHHHDARVHQSADDLRPRLDLAVEILGQVVDGLVELAGQLRTTQHAGVVGGECLGVGCGGLGEGRAGVQQLDHVGDDPAEHLVGGLVGDRLE
jgi:hypothetical protein